MWPIIPTLTKKCPGKSLKMPAAKIRERLQAKKCEVQFRCGLGFGRMSKLRGAKIVANSTIKSSRKPNFPRCCQEGRDSGFGTELTKSK